MIESGDNKVIVSFSPSLVAKVVSALPSGAFVVSVLLSVLKDFESSTATHCQEAVNYLPSISASVGGFTPQRYIWRICIALHCTPRLLLAICYHRINLSWITLISFNYQKYYCVIVHVMTAAYVLENVSLIILSFVSSTENYAIHEKGFIGFVIFSEIYMILTVASLFWKRAVNTFSTDDQKSLRLKCIILVINFLSCFFAGYFFVRHSAHCESGVYTMFALCEYLIVATNISFHVTCIIYDLQHVTFCATVSTKPYFPLSNSRSSLIQSA